MWQVLVIRARDYTKELQISKDVMISNEMTSGLSCLSPSHSTASKSNIFLRPQGLIVSLGLQTKLTLSFTFKHFISYENKKALQVTMEELISKSLISQNIFFLLILLCVEHLQDDKHSARCCKVWWKMQNRLGHQISCLVHKEIYGYYLKINQFIKANKMDPQKRGNFKKGLHR